jgi:hypothetical protein
MAVTQYGPGGRKSGRSRRKKKFVPLSPKQKEPYQFGDTLPDYLREIVQNKYKPHITTPRPKSPRQEIRSPVVAASGDYGGYGGYGGRSYYPRGGGWGGGGGGWGGWGGGGGSFVPEFWWDPGLVNWNYGVRY